MQSRLLGVLIVLLSLGQLAKADSFGFSLGVSLQNTCMPGSVVSIDAVLMNTGSTPIVFAPKGGHSGSVPFASVDGEGQWSILGSGFSYSDFNSQFAGVTVRSEEHTSELQSHSFISYAVFCLKKKKINTLRL